MPILNLENYPFLWTWGRPKDASPDLKPENYILWRSGLEIEWYNDLVARSENLFIILFMLDDAFSVFPIDTILSPEQYQMLKRGEITLVLENSGHGYNQNVGGIYKDIIVKHDINPRNIILRTESADMHEEVKLISQHLNLPEVRLEWIRQFESQYSTEAKTYALTTTLAAKNYGNKKFLSYNGLFRPHRGILIFLLQCYGVLDQGYVSYNIKNDFHRNETNEHVTWLKSFYSEYPEIAKMFEENREQLANIIKLELDDWKEKNTAGHYQVDNHYYENTYFSVVTETSFPCKPFNMHYPKHTDTGRILSEKIFKPILNWHPFVVASNYRTLALLKSLGYKSFSPYINESYDEIEDDMLRLVAVAKEVKRLCEMSRMELDEFLVGCRKICEFNWNHLKETRNFVTKLNY